jgi:hypothetical protein
MGDLLSRLHAVARSGNGWIARCPAHDDHHNSLSVHHREGRWLVRCHAGCRWEDIVDALGLSAQALYDENGAGGGRSFPVNNRATAQPLLRTSNDLTGTRALETTSLSPPSVTGLTLDEYAAAKNVPVNFLRAIGLSEISYDRKPALRIPYRGIAGEEKAIRIRVALDGDRFRWKSGSKPLLYGLHRIGNARKAGHVALVEGESPTATHYGFTEFMRLAFREQPIGVKIVTPQTCRPKIRQPCIWKGRKSSRSDGRRPAVEKSLVASGAVTDVTGIWIKEVSRACARYGDMLRKRHIRHCGEEARARFGRDDRRRLRCGQEEAPTGSAPRAPRRRCPRRRSPCSRSADREQFCEFPCSFALSPQHQQKGALRKDNFC